MQYVTSRGFITIGLLFCLELPLIQSAVAKDNENPLPGSEVAGEVVSTSGRTFIRQDGLGNNKDTLKPAKPGDMVRANDVVNTSSDGKIKILLKDKTVIDLGPSALLKIEKYVQNSGKDRQVEMNLPYGTVRGAVTQKIEGKGKFHLRTPTATMGVRGTEFVVESKEKAYAPPKDSSPGQNAKKNLEPNSETKITVIQGKVEVAKNAAMLSVPDKSRKPSSLGSIVALTAGTQLTSNTKDLIPSKAVSLNTSELSKISQSIKIVDNTFSKAVVIDVAATSAGAPGSGGGSKSAAGGGELTQMAISTAVASATAVPISATDLGISGTFGVNNVLNQSNVTHLNNLRTLTIRVIR